ncbi:DNA alpha-glucosyltransferase [Dirofilaria immitis]
MGSMVTDVDPDRDSVNMPGLERSPIFALDQLKQAGVPFEKQLSPYLQMDPTVFRESTPQEIEKNSA